MIFFFFKYVIKNINDNKENNVNCKAPLIGIKATVKVKSGCEENIKVLKSANFIGINNCLSKRKRQQAMNANNKMFDR